MTGALFATNPNQRQQINMAAKAKIGGNAKKKKLIEKYASRRAELKARLVDMEASDEAREEAMFKLQGLPRNSSRTRYRNRCVVSGRPRGYYRKFGLSRIALRELGLRGEVPGLTKSSW